MQSNRIISLASGELSRLILRPTIYQKADNEEPHVASVTNVSIGDDPAQWSTTCSCGWKGIDVTEVLFQFERFIEPIKALRRDYSIDEIVSREDLMGGDLDDAYLQILHHVNYDDGNLEWAKRRFTEDQNRLSQMVENNDFEDYSKVLKQIRKTIDFISVHEIRMSVLKTEEVRSHVFIEGMDEKIKAILENYRKTINYNAPNPNAS